MYKRIVVPLDGSKLAEAVLPHVEHTATTCGGEIVLTTVTERISGRSRSVSIASSGGSFPVLQPVVKMPVAVGKMQRQGQRYLDRIARRLRKKGISNVRTAVLLGNPAEEISTFAEEEKADLIIMASHGRSGPSRWAFGSVSDRVLRASHCPVLLVRATTSDPGG